MNILFYCNHNVQEPICGGIVRVSSLLNNIFAQHGHHNYLAYYYSDANATSQSFVKSIQCERHKEENIVADFIKENSIDVILLLVPLNNSTVYILDFLNKFRKSWFHGQLIHPIHTIPFAELKGWDWPYIKYNLHRKDYSFSLKLKTTLWGIMCNIFPRYTTQRVARRYQNICDTCDQVVLLSDYYLPFFKKHVNTSYNVCGINNPYVYSNINLDIDIRNKQKIVLMVGRLNEDTKRISRALKIWKLIEQKYHQDYWKLKIVGSGDDLAYYTKLARKYKLHNVSFEGRQNPRPYYQEASILMMTSAIEGLPMVIIEAKQMGVVPIAFNSYEAVYDLIDPTKDGVIVENEDINIFAERLYQLMSNDAYRNTLAVKAIEINDKFSEENIYHKWEELFKR